MRPFEQRIGAFGVPGVQRLIAAGQRRVEGDTEKLVGRVQERYGYARDDAKRDVDAFLDRQFP